MFAPDFYIDSFQTTKKIVTNQIITDGTLNKVAHRYIDAQTAFAKSMIQNTLDVATYSTNSISSYFFPKTEQVQEEKTEVKARKTSKAKVAEATDTNTQGE
jgi:hypothetical protein